MQKDTNAITEGKVIANLFQLMSVSASANSAAGAASASRAIDLAVWFRDHKAIGMAMAATFVLLLQLARSTLPWNRKVAERKRKIKRTWFG